MHRPGKEADILWHPVKHVSPLRRAVRWAKAGLHPR
jgi:hypothetical protein